MVEYVYREEVRRQTVRRAIDASPSRNDGPTTTAKEATLDGHSGLAEQCYGSRLFPKSGAGNWHAVDSQISRQRYQSETMHGW